MLTVFQGVNGILKFFNLVGRIKSLFQDPDPDLLSVPNPNVYYRNPNFSFLSLYM